MGTSKWGCSVGSWLYSLKTKTGLWTEVIVHVVVKSWCRILKNTTLPHCSGEDGKRRLNRNGQKARRKIRVSGIIGKHETMGERVLRRVKLSTSNTDKGHP